MIYKTHVVTLLIAFAGNVFASDASIIGAWKTIDDNSNKPRSIIRISEVNNQFEGSLEKIFPEPNEEQNPLCDKCQGALKGKPVIGMKIVNGLKKNDEEFSGGTIMDPDNGKTYKCKMWLEENGAKLKVRG